MSSYLAHQDALKKLGIEEVIIYCVNDGAVMKAWGLDQKIEGSMLTFMGDPTGALTTALDRKLTHPGPTSVGILNRCKRFALFIDDKVIKVSQVCEDDDDPAGDDFPEDTCAPAMIELIKGL
eukprot:CAMPEP_0194369472 /NCGR_PEP_ID=MMETSP0174-20130528/17783_1 /TAXON_ID=216777 /ORGANISM="Proboscia alata, Strain PI-D3" /LENGTH=121 /DNA_ID=CAMNT_0039146439 /DNA_START=200 /DNA_END=566 /DNA_ORIENTATION=-